MAHGCQSDKISTGYWRLDTAYAFAYTSGVLAHFSNPMNIKLEKNLP